MSEKFPTFNSPELAHEEAAKMAEKIESGEAKDYNEAEKMTEIEETINPKQLLEKSEKKLDEETKKNHKSTLENRGVLIKDNWLTNRALAKELSIAQGTVKKIVNNYRISHPEWFKELKNSQGKTYEHYSPELVKVIEDELKKEGKLKKYEQAPDNWLTNWALVKKLSITQETVKKIVNNYRISHPEWFQEFKNPHGRTLEHYSPELVKAIKDDLTKYEQAPDNWLTNKAISKQLQVGRLTIKNIADKYHDIHPEWFKELKNSQGKTYEHYSPELVKAIKDDLTKYEQAPDNWLTNNAISKQLQVNFSTAKNIADKYHDIHPEWFKELKNSQGQILEHYSPELVKVIEDELKKEGKLKKYEQAPDNWLTNNAISKQLQVNFRTVKNIADKYHDIHPEWFKSYLSKRGHIDTYYSPELQEVVISKLNQQKNDKEQKETDEKANKNFDDYIREVSEGKTVTAQEFKKLIGLFGSSRAFDILYKHHPQFKGVPVDRVKSVLPQYLGNYLLTRPPFSIDDIKDFTDYLSKQTFQEGLFETMKEHALKFYNKERREKENMGELVNSQSVFGKYIQNLKEKTELIKNNNLNQVIKKFEDYYLSLFNDFKKPDKIVEFLKEDRMFPDVNQLINIKEISDNKKMLIADDMGLGKSASVILAKEILSLKRALIITPSNVVEMNTWQDYLSDKISKEGKQIGYFKKGTAPKVLVIKSLDDINDSNLSSCDYIIISQEKLKDNYVNKLKEINYDMLVFDEVHKLKNLKEGERAKRAVELSGKINGSEKYLALLSGTPVPDKIKDLAIILKLLYPEKFTNIKNKELVRQIVTGDIIDLRNLLIPKMQMKELAESIKMPSKRERLIETELSEKGKEIYEMLMEEDELTAIEKIRIFRQFLLNPKIFGISPEIENSKLKNVENFLNQTFKEKNKIVMFVNDYIEGVIRGGNSIINELQLSGMNIIIIDGNTPKKERNAKQKEFRESSNKTLLVVSGPTADVGVDFSSGESVVFYNEPWSRYNERQQAGRVYREGVKNDIDVNIFVTKNSIEEGLYRYIRIKEKSVEKLLKGIPITDIEKEHLLKDEKRNDSGLEENSELAKYYFNSWDRMLKIFAHVKEMGEKNFLDFTRKYGKEYAKCYIDFGGRSYQSNTARVIGTVISKLVEENKQSNNDLRILDIASGPEMLKRHILEKHQNKIFSMDINESHFEEPGEGKRLVGSFLNLSVKDKIFDYANLSLAFHYTENKKPYKERIKVLSEMNRVLKVGGRALINFTYSLNLQDEQRFKKIFDNLGFKIIENYSGQVNCGDNYKSRLITLEKINDIKENERINDDSLEGLRLNKTNEILKNQRKIIKEFIIGNKKMTVDFNKEDYELLKKEEEVIKIGENLKRKYGSVKNIPAEEIKRHDFILFPVPKKNRYEYLLFKSLGDKKGNVVIK